MAAVKLAFEDNENMRRVEEKGEIMKTKERENSKVFANMIFPGILAPAS